MKKERLTPSSIPAPWELAKLPKDTAVLLAFSGGMDSSALLHLLAAQSERDGFHLYAAHLHHGIRGEEADRDADFCASLAKRYEIPLFLAHADVPTLAAERGQSVEEAAREARYAFFASLMHKHGIGLLVTAHHADDHLETVLFRMARGTGLQGLCGISAARPFANGFLVRPLLAFSRSEIEAYREREQLPFVVDSTNGDSAYTRNRIRAEVIPAFERVGGDLRQSVLRMSHSLAQDADFLQNAAASFYEKNRTEKGMPIKELLEAHPAIRNRVLVMMAPCGLEAVHLDAIERLLLSGKSGSRCPLPDRWVACLQNGMLSVLPDLRRAEIPERIPFGEGEQTLCDGRLRICVTKCENLKDAPIVHNLSTDACIILDGTAVESAELLVWRVREAGDTLLVGGKRCKLGDLSRRRGIPTVLREAIPILTNAEEILWAPFIGARDGVTARGASRWGYRIVCSVSSGADQGKD